MNPASSNPLSDCRPVRPASDARQRGSVLVLSVVLIVLLVMMGASYLQMARSDRRSTLQMDTRSQDYQDSILRYIGLTLAADVEFDAEYGDDPDTTGVSETNRFRRWGAERYDYPFTWSGLDAFQPGAGVGTDVVFPVPPSARRGLLPANAGSAFQTQDPDVDDPPGGTLQERAADDYFFADGTGTGPEGRSAFDGDLRVRLFGAGGSGPFGVDLGQNDDMWLASTAPQFGGTLPNGDPLNLIDPTGQGVWPNLSNLTGVFIDLGRLDADNQPTVYISTADDEIESTSVWVPLATMQGDLGNAPGSGNPIRFADADGDGIADSRWTFAPVGGDAGLTYVMAVRIVDNSSMVNLNTASTYELNPTQADEKARWYTPGDLNLTEALEGNNLAGVNRPVYDPNAAAGNALTLLFNDPAGSATGVRDMADPSTFNERTKNYLLISQSFGNPASVLPPDSPWDEVGSGLEQIADGANTDYPSFGNGGVLSEGEDVSGAMTTPLRLSGLNEAELRWKNGLNRTTPDGSTVTADADVEARTDPRFWRQNNLEIDYLDTGLSIQQYFERNPRLRSTVISGSGDFDTLNINLAESEDIRDFLLDLNQPAIDGGELSLSDGTTLGGNFAFLDQVGLSQNDIGWENFSDMAAAFWNDWRDNDRSTGDVPYGTNNTAIPRLTERGRFYGMEYLPFISEVYLKAEYEADAITTGTAFLSDGVTPADSVEWDASGAYALVIEIVNPWNQPIPIANVELALIDPGSANPDNPSGASNVSFGNLRNLLTGAGGLGREYLEPNEAVVLHFGDFADADQLGEVNGATSGMTRISLGATAGAWQVDGSDRWDLAPGWTLGMFASDNAGDPIPYQRFAVPTIPATVTELFPTATNLVTPGTIGVARISIIGTGAGLAALTVAPEDLELQDTFDLGDSFPDRDNPPAVNDNAGQDLEVLIENPDSGVSGPTGVQSQLGIYNKGRTSPVLGNALDTRVVDAATVSGSVGVGVTVASAANDEPFLIGNAGQFYKAADVFRVVYLGPQDDTPARPAILGDIRTIAEVWRDGQTHSAAGNFAVRDFMIDADPRTSPTIAPASVLANFLTEPNLQPANLVPTAASGVTPPAHLRTTFPAFLLDRLSTFSPGSDNIDNDSDGRVDDTDERLVLGRINLNTIPASTTLVDLLALTMPRLSIPGNNGIGIANDLEDAIQKARTYLPGVNGGWEETEPPNQRRQASALNAGEHGMGIASMGHLMDVLFESGTISGATSNELAANVIYDFNEYESGLRGDETPIGGTGSFAALNANYFDDGHDNDAEERLALLGAMKQVFDVRSDIFTAYIRVRGYPANDFSSNPIEEYTITATFDRSVVHESRPLPRLVAVSIRRQDGP